MLTTSSDENSVCLSVCLMRALWQNGRKVSPGFIPCQRSFSLVVSEEEWFWGVTPSTWNFVSTGPHWSEIADFEPIIARSASAVQPSEKSSPYTNRKSPTRFPTSPRWSSYVAPKSPKGFKNAKRPISVQNRTRFKKVCYTKFLCVKTVSDKVVRHLLV